MALDMAPKRDNSITTSLSKWRERFGKHPGALAAFEREKSHIGGRFAQRSKPVPVNRPEHVVSLIGVMLGYRQRDDDIADTAGLDEADAHVPLLFPNIPHRS